MIIIFVYLLVVSHKLNSLKDPVIKDRIDVDRENIITYLWG